jgi:hypothetical protein
MELCQVQPGRSVPFCSGHCIDAPVADLRLGALTGTIPVSRGQLHPRTSTISSGRSQFPLATTRSVSATVSETQANRPHEE